jgi:hypothetical protein
MKPSHFEYHWFSHSSKTTLAAKPDSVAADVLQPVILYSIAGIIKEDQAFSPPFHMAPPPSFSLRLHSVSSTGDTEED